MIQCPLWNGFRVITGIDKNKPIAAVKCNISHYDSSNYLGSWTIKEFENLEVSDFIKITQTWPENYDRKIHGLGCQPGVSICWAEPETLNFKHVEVSLQTECNLHCRFCGAKPNQNFVKNNGLNSELKKVNFEFLYKLKNLELDYIRLTDYGEPFFFLEKIKKWISQLTKKDTKQFKATTNGTLIDNELISIMKNKQENGVMFELVISLNSVTKKSYLEKMGKDYFFKVLSNIFKLHQNNIPCTISFVIDNIEEINHILSFSNFLKSLKIPFYLYPDDKQRQVILNSGPFKKYLESIKQK